MMMMFISHDQCYIITSYDVEYCVKEKKTLGRRAKETHMGIYKVVPL